MLYTGTATVAAHGTPVALAAVRTPASWVTVHARANNAGPVYVGGVTDVAAPLNTDAVKNAVDNANAYVGHRLIPGDFVNLREMGGATYLDLRYIYVDADNDGDVVTFNYGRR